MHYIAQQSDLYSLLSILRRVSVRSFVIIDRLIHHTVWLPDCNVSNDAISGLLHTQDGANSILMCTQLLLEVSTDEAGRYDGADTLPVSAMGTFHIKYES